MEGGFVKVGGESRMVISNQVIRYQERGKKGILRQVLSIFWDFGERPGKRGRKTNFKISNEGIGNEVFAAKTIQNTGILRRFIGLFVRKKGFLEGDSGELVRILWRVWG